MWTGVPRRDHPVPVGRRPQTCPGITGHDGGLIGYDDITPIDAATRSSARQLME
jgi:hypothetical protein